MTTIYFIRHGEVDYIPDDYLRPLSSKGDRDSRALVELFKDIELTMALSSPFLRAIDTIKYICEDKGIIITTIEDLRERKVAKEHIDDFHEFSKNQWSDFDYKEEAGESLNDVKIRSRNVLKNILNDYQDEKIVIGTHGTFLGVLLNSFDAKYDYEFWKSIENPDVFLFEFSGEELMRIEHLGK